MIVDFSSHIGIGMSSVLGFIKDSNTVFWSMYFISRTDRLTNQWITKRLEITND